MQQISRGGYEDLVVTLKHRVTITETRSEGMLKLFISAVDTTKPAVAENTEEPKQQPTQAQLAVPPATQLPVRFYTKGVPNDQNQLIISFPNLQIMMSLHLLQLYAGYLTLQVLRALG